MVTGIVEHKDATDEQRATREINSGIYTFDETELRGSLEQVTSDNAQGEMYLTDVLGITRRAGEWVVAGVTEEHWQVGGTNDRGQ